MGLEINVPALEQSLIAFAARSENAISLLCQSAALDAEGYMKTHRPWTDRTGQARQRLTGRAAHPSKTEWEIVLSHGVDYGIYLEFAHEKKYAIIYPTIQVKSPDIMNSFQGLIDSLSSLL